MAFYQFKETISHKTENFPVAYYSVDLNHPRYEMRHHWHPEYELIYISLGRLNLTLDKSVYKLEEGQFALIPPGTVHSGIPENCVYECVVFDLNALARGCHAMTKEINGLLSRRLEAPPVYRFFEGEPEKYMLALVNVMRKNNSNTLTSLSAIFGLFGSLIECGLVSEADGYSKIPQKLGPFENSLSFIEKNYKNHISLLDISVSAGMSPKYFGEYFKKITDKTPFEYLNEYRIERACELLCQNDNSIIDIALDCGFNDLSYFIKTFRLHKNTTPAKYRKAQQR